MNSVGARILKVADEARLPVRREERRDLPVGTLARGDANEDV